MIKENELFSSLDYSEVTQVLHRSVDLPEWLAMLVQSTYYVGELPVMCIATDRFLLEECIRLSDLTPLEQVIYGL